MFNLNFLIMSCNTYVEFLEYKKIRESHRRQIGDVIVRTRRMQGLSQKQLAELVGIDPGNLSRIESGRCNYSIDMLYGIMRVLELDITFSINPYGVK